MVSSSARLAKTASSTTSPSSACWHRSSLPAPAGSPLGDFCRCPNRRGRGARCLYWNNFPARSGAFTLHQGGAARKETGVAFVMGQPAQQPSILATCEQLHALLAVTEAILAHRDLPALFHGLAGRLHHVVPFDFLILVLHEPARDAMRIHVLETSEPSPGAGRLVPVSESPSGL